MEKYTQVRTIGQGSFGKAILVRNTADGKLYVMKQINVTQMSRKERDEALNEIKVLSALNHPNIVTYRESFVEKNAIAIIMDYCEGGTRGIWGGRWGKGLFRCVCWCLADCGGCHGGRFGRLWFDPFVCVFVWLLCLVCVR